MCLLSLQMWLQECGLPFEGEEVYSESVCQYPLTSAGQADLGMVGVVSFPKAVEGEQDEGQEDQGDTGGLSLKGPG